MIDKIETPTDHVEILIRHHIIMANGSRESLAEQTKIHDKREKLLNSLLSILLGSALLVGSFIPYNILSEFGVLIGIVGIVSILFCAVYKMSNDRLHDDIEEMEHAYSELIESYARLTTVNDLSKKKHQKESGLVEKRKGVNNDSNS